MPPAWVRRIVHQLVPLASSMTSTLSTKTAMPLFLETPSRKDGGTGC